MVEARSSLEPEVKEILAAVDKNRNFLLSGGAGSGKTYSLVQVIRQVIAENPTSKVACMTYTNAAVNEIRDRVNHENLSVSTIHDFLWSNIKHFQKELKIILISLLNDTENSRFTIVDEQSIPYDYYDKFEEGIQYKEYLILQKGIISHDELIIIANRLFEVYPKLCDLVKDKYRFIFIDEYQDTSKLVIEIFLNHFAASKKKNVIGFFGDAMQSIYDDGIGNLNAYIGEEDGQIKEIKKTQNRRNPQKVINLANLIRTDGLKQVASLDVKAPNMLNGQIKDGNVVFLYSKDGNISNVKQSLTDSYGWNFRNKDTKELNLTHNLIAGRAGFRRLMDVYDNDPIIGLKSEILKKNKENLKNNHTGITINQDDTFEDVVNKFQIKNRSRVLKKDLLLQNPDTAKLYDQLKDKLFADVRKIYINKDALIDDKKQNEIDLNRKGSKRDNLIKHLFKIQSNISLYKNKQYNEFLRVTDYRDKITRINDKTILKENIESLIDVGEKTIETVILEAHEKGICLLDDKMSKFIVNNEYLYDRIKEIEFSEFQKLYEYLEGKTPFSTQHKIKGAEFDYVLVILDNGGWNSYNFEDLFLKKGTETVLSRTQKLFYVCCTRSKDSLAVYYNNPSKEVIVKVKELFGEENVKEIK
ncbi:UvrD-helicase domain-containing protein [Leptospira sp. 'Mane']|uniref:UvrD-helicase domain-containing protein n=1 Tax=Leptospira sp. 'Mane' TaxID=3387407 RepID=UPI00398B76F8